MANQKLAIVSLVILIFSNVLGGFLFEYFNADEVTTTDVEGQLTGSLNSETVEYSASGITTILKAISGVLFWSWGLLPWWIDLILWIFRLILIFYVVDVILP